MVDGRNGVCRSVEGELGMWFFIMMPGIKRCMIG